MKDLLVPKKWFGGRVRIRVELLRTGSYYLAESFSNTYGFSLFYRSAGVPCRIGIKRGMFGKWQYVNNYHPSNTDARRTEYIIPHLCEMLMVKECDVKYVSIITNKAEL